MNKIERLAGLLHVPAASFSYYLKVRRKCGAVKAALADAQV